MIVIGNNSVTAEIARTSTEHERGLMYRTEMCENCGMIFVFNDEATRTFWMKNTLIPLEMIFLAEDGRIIDIQEAEPCKKDPCTVYTSKGPAKYVLELNKGYSKEKGIKVNTTVEIKI